MPMVWYVPPLSPVQSQIDQKTLPTESDGVIPKASAMRLPVQYLANLLTAGKEAPVQLALERMLAMRAYQRLASPAARQTIGTAMTPQEIKRLDQWLPMLESTDERVIRSGVQNFFREADAIYKERLQFMKASGINTDALEGLPAQFDAMAKVALPSAGASDRGRQPAPAPQSGGVKVPWTTKKGS